MGDDTERIEVVRGALDPDRRREILEFWRSRSAGDVEGAENRFPQVVCVMRDARGSMVGVNAVRSRSVPLIGGRTFWIYSSLIDEAASKGSWMSMLGACFDALSGELAAGPGEGVAPIGVCALVGDPALLDRHPEALWPALGFLYAGYAPDGRQVRIRYFEDGRV